MNDLDYRSLWPASARESMSTEAIATLPVSIAIIEAKLKRDGRTPLIKLFCGPHYSRYGASLSIVDDRILINFRHEDDVPPGGIMALAPSSALWPARYDVTCGRCGRRTAVKSSRMLYLLIQATLDTPDKPAPFSTSIT